MPATANLRRWERRIKVQGRSVKLFKREDSAEAAYYVHIQIGGRRYLRSLKTPLAATAEARAKVWAGNMLNQAWLDRMAADLGPARTGQPNVALVPESQRPAAAKPFCSLGRLLEVYALRAPTAGGGIKPRTAKNNAACLRNLVTLARQTKKPDEESTAVLSGLTLRVWADRWVAAYLADAGEDEEAQDCARAKAGNSGASNLRQARSVLKEELLPIYADEGLHLPDLEGFMSQKVFRTSKPDYRPADDATVAATFAAVAALDLGTAENRNLARVFLLASGCGLRKSEIASLQAEDFSTVNGAPWVVRDRHSKGGELLRVPIAAGWEKLQPLLPKRGPVLEGTETERRDTVFRRLSAWMEGLGWTSEKRAHELRSWAICQVVMRYGWEAGRQFARHSDVQVTQKAYGRYVAMVEVSIEPGGSRRRKATV